ncbi:MAG: macrocin O-methyltransferase [Actinomyces sp.]|nr:MAG: macrocin O-methyltransferase [Actinomyces sp.]
MGCLTRELFCEEEARDVDLSDWAGPGDPAAIRRHLGEQGWRLVTRGADPARRREGRDWPPHAETMVGRLRLEQIRSCVEAVLADGVPGDLVETGVWRGGVCILMRALLEAHGDTERRVWVADSFRGLPPPGPDPHPAEVTTDWSQVEVLAVDADTVRANFARYGLLDERVCFLEGWFADTLPDAPIERVAVLRLDGDMYASTLDALDALYDRVSVGGFVVVDDYGAWPSCRAAVDDFRAAHGIHDELVAVDWTGVHWRRSS